MAKSKKNILAYILGYAIVIIASMYVKPYIGAYDELKDRMYYNFEDFGIELERLNDELSHMIVLDNYDFNKEKNYVNEKVMFYFRISAIDAARISKEKEYNDYNYLYWQLNDTIKNIVSDNVITENERKYLESLYEYNDELLKEYKNVTKNIRWEYDFDEKMKLEKRIVKIYNNYSKMAEHLLNTPKYSFLIDYKGDIYEADYEKTKIHCEEIFSKLVKDRILKYNNKNEENTNEYIFKTSLRRGLPSTLEELQSKVVDYEVSYDKKTKKIRVDATSYNVPERPKYIEGELYEIAHDAIDKYNKNVFNYDKKIRYGKDGKLSWIRYYYIENVDDIYDEMKKIEIEIQYHGLVTELDMMYPHEEKIRMPIVSKREILEKINKDAEIVDCIVIRNIEGKTDYVVHLKYEDTLCEAVFDGETGKVKYYGREINKRYLVNN